MKTSDKLLLGTALGAMLLFGGASLAVYARYKNGDIITEKRSTGKIILRQLYRRRRGCV